MLEPIPSLTPIQEDLSDDESSSEDTNQCENVSNPLIDETSLYADAIGSSVSNAIINNDENSSETDANNSNHQDDGSLLEQNISDTGTDASDEVFDGENAQAFDSNIQTETSSLDNFSEQN